MPAQRTPIIATETIDVDALVGNIKIDVVHAAAEALTLGRTWCSERPGAGELNEMQAIFLSEAALEAFQGIETKIRDALEQAIPHELRWQPSAG